jgi:Golgi SNAP receptor complex protein 1
MCEIEALRKQARQLENEIDSKLVAYSKLCSNYTSTALSSVSVNVAAAAAQQQQQPNTSSDLLFATLSNDLEDALKKLTTVNGRMSEALNSESNVNSSATVHTMQVHHLRDYKG